MPLPQITRAIIALAEPNYAEARTRQPPLAPLPGIDPPAGIQPLPGQQAPAAPLMVQPAGQLGRVL